MLYSSIVRALSIVLVLAGFSGLGWADELFQKTLTATDVERITGDTDWVVVDTRLNDAFNGWQLDGVTRGGHLPGAVDFSANWLRVQDNEADKKLAEALKIKGIDKESAVLLYDANGQDARQVAQYLKEQDYNQLYYFNIHEWMKDGDRPLQKFPNYQRIIPATILKQLLDGERPESFEQAGEIIIVEASWGDESKSYSKGHIPTAFHINTDDIEPLSKVLPPMWMLAKDADLFKVAQVNGITKHDTVIVTGEETLAAYRVASILEYLGVKDVRILNGGVRAWTLAGYELETKSHKPVPVKDFGAAEPLRPNVIETLAEVQEKLKQEQGFTLVDNRTMPEYLGETSGYNYHLRRGRIPGAKFGYAGNTDSYSLDVFRNIDGTMRNPYEFLELWRGQGIDLNDSLAFMCGSGWRAAEVFFYADVAGLKDISIFSDGWIGWSNAGLPTIRGE